MMPVRSRSSVDLSSLVLGSVLMLLLFAACFLLLEYRDAPPGQNASVRITNVPVSRESLTMGCVLLAGLVGGYLQYMRERFNELTAAEQRPPPQSSDAMRADAGAPGAWWAFLSQLLMGLCAASAMGLFIPLAIANPPGLSIYNPWGLLILGVVSGYLSRHVFGGLQAKFERLFGELQRAGTGGNAAEISSAVRQGVLEALGSPTPVNFDGSVSLDVVDASGASCVQREDRRVYALLRRGADYTLRAEFKPADSTDQGRMSESADVQYIRIDGGEDAARVPFELRLELSFLPDAGSLDQAVTVARHSNDRVAFAFYVPDHAEAQEASSADAPSESESSSRADPAASEMVLFVYQKSIFCAAASLPVRWLADPT